MRKEINFKPKRVDARETRWREAACACANEIMAANADTDSVGVKEWKGKEPYKRTFRVTLTIKDFHYKEGHQTLSRINTSILTEPLQEEMKP